MSLPAWTVLCYRSRVYSRLFQKWSVRSWLRSCVAERPVALFKIVFHNVTPSGRSRGCASGRERGRWPGAGVTALDAVDNIQRGRCHGRNRVAVVALPVPDAAVVLDPDPR